MALLALFVISVLAVGGFAIWFSPKSNTVNQLILSFSGAYLFGYIFMHILPESFGHGHMNMGVFVLVGFLLQLLLDFISKGIEHGHAHHNDAKFPVAIFIGLCIHSLIEGMPLVDHSEVHQHFHSNAFGIGILVHKIPITIVLAGLLKSYYSKAKSFVLITVFALTVPLGTFFSSQLAHLFHDILTYHQIILALLVGVLLHVSTTILYESDKGHKFNLNKVISILLGFGIAYALSGIH